MKPRKLQISRDGLVLGELSESEVAELLKVGFFKPTDLWRKHWQESWSKLSELLPASQKEKAQEGWFQQAKTTVGNVGTSLASGASRVGEGLTAQFTGAKNKLNQAREHFLMGFVHEIAPRVQALFASQPARAVQAALRDEIIIRKVFGAAYDCLPKPVCRFVSEADFVTFCLRHQQRLIEPPSTESTSSNKTS